MMIRSVASFIFIALGTCAYADPIFVRSGDHPRFARLVLQLPKNAEWAATQTPGKAEIKLTNHKDGFDISRVFDLISRDRIQQISASDSQVTLTLNCACEISLDEIKGRFLVIDIADQGHATGEVLRIVEPLSTPTISMKEITAAYQDQSKQPSPKAPEIEPVPLPWLGRPIDGYDPNVDFNASRHDAAPERDLANSRETKLPPDRLSHFEANLTEQISRAATQGILNADRAEFPLAKPQADVVAQTAKPEPPEPEFPPVPGGNLRVTTSLDRMTEANTMTLFENGIICPKDVLGESKWDFENRSFNSELARLRSTLFTEFDRLDAKVARELVSLYLNAGFGAEAADVLRDADLLPDEAVLHEISQIFEFGTVRNGATLQSYIECETDIALWAILATGAPSSEKTPNSSAALRALNNLPAHLRRILAPMLTERLLRFSDKAGAAAALRSVERLDENQSGASLLARADLDHADGRSSESEASLEEIVAENSEQSPVALVRLIRSKLAARSPIDIELATLVEAYAQEYEGSDTGDDLAEVRIIAFAQSGQFDRAFSTLTKTKLSEAKAETIRFDVLRNLVEFASDTVFLEFAYRQIPQIIAENAPELAKDMGTRLEELRFPAQAQAFYPDGTARADRSRDTESDTDKMWERIITEGADEGPTLTAIQSNDVSIPEDNNGLLALSQNVVEESRKARNAIHNLLEASGRDIEP